MADAPATLSQTQKYFKLDLQLKDRELAAKIAADNALDAYRLKHMELIEQGQLQQQADQYAKDYALQTYKFEFEKELGLRQIQGAEQQASFTQEMTTRQQDFNERWKEQEATGFVGGTPTLDREKFWETQRQFDVTQGESQRQFNVNAVMNAPRGPADWGAYTNRLRGLQSSGALPPVIGNLVTGQPIAAYSNAGQPTAPVMTNTQMAQLAVGQPAAGSWAQWAPYAAPAAAAGQLGPASAPVYSNAGPAGAPPAPSYSAAAGGQQPQPVNQAGQMFNLGGQPQQQVSGRDVSYQQFQNLTPDEQQMTIGYAGEGMGGFMPQSQQDFLDQMKDAAPQFRPSTQARFSGVR